MKLTVITIAAAILLAVQSAIICAQQPPIPSTGCVSGNCVNGRGKKVYANGESYEGGWVNSQKEGYGTYTFKSGAVHTGQYVKDEMKGKGKFTFVNGDTYDGDFVDDKREGQGTYTYKDGSYHTGAYENDKRNGYGKDYIKSTNITRQGLWKDDVFGPTFWSYKRDQGYKQFAAKKYAEAVISYTECIQGYAKADECYNGRGKAYWTLGKKVEAAADLEKAVKLNPNNKDAVADLKLMNEEKDKIFNSDLFLPFDYDFSGIFDFEADKSKSDKQNTDPKAAQAAQKNPAGNANAKTPVIEIADKSVMRIGEIKDIKPDDNYYKALKNLTEKYGVITVYQDSTFRLEKPLTRLQFAISINYSLDVMVQVMSASDLNYLDILYNTDGYPANNKITSMKTVKDIPPDFVEFGVLQRLYEDYRLNLGDSDGYFRPNKEMSEKEYLDALEGIFGIEHNAQASPTKIITRGRFVKDLSVILDHKNEVFGEEAEKSSNEKKIEIIRNLPSKGKAKVTSHLKFYLIDSPCIDLKNASSEIRESFVKGGVWGDYRIKDDDIGDIVFESTDTCRKGKLVLLRVGTAIVTMNEKGIKRIK